MLWDIRTLMRPALSVIDLIPNIHRTPALASLRRAVLEGRPATLRLSDEDREFAFHDAHVQLTSPIGARVLRILYDTGNLKLKKPPAKSLPALEAYIASEPAFRAEVARIIAADDAKRTRQAAIIADPGIARPEDLSPDLIDKVISARLGHTATGSLEIAGILCHRSLVTADENGRTRAESTLACWWTDSTGQHHGDPV
ncbi:hypothetical protein [Pseudotabrizicola alkalilacus]|uniref:Uncharacterized protein n=1 Tax=Pseudotabrizicola alkalilacus TaxID=2305252 RepID=A0A411YZ86_9RHOB|nr:hypothetical protein [Pseudotabrizicola alkalilacus]RGP36124.1 hypothetical protein D1012_17115 [Pseudotabrizicola alkalilacus]